MQQNTVKPNLWSGCAQCTPSQQWVTHLRSFSQRINGFVTAEYRNFSCYSRNISVLIQKVSGQIPNACVESNYVLRGNAVKLQFDFECLFLPKARRQPLPSEKLKGWQSGDWKPFFSVISVWLVRDFPLLKFTKAVAMCIMHVYFLISVVWLQ